MKPWKTIGARMALLMLLVMPASVYARRKEKNAEEFPDYNRLEYTKPRPPADQQVPESPPGSIQRRFGDKRGGNNAIPLDSLPVMLRKSQAADETEPSMNDLFNEPAASTAPAVSTEVPAVSTAPTTSQ